MIYDIRFWIKLITIRDDQRLLQKVNDLIGNVNLHRPIFKVTAEQRNMLMESEQDIQYGNIISDDDLNDEDDLWLNA